MTKKMKIAFWIYVAFDILFGGFCGGLIPLTPLVGAQTMLTMTTLSNAVQGVGSVNGATPTGNQSIVTVASATGISGPAANTSFTSGIAATSDAQSYLYVDRELMQVKAVSGTTLTVIRGVGSTSAVSHASGSLIFVLPSAVFGIWSGGGYVGNNGPSVPQGSCTRTSELYLPRIDFSSGVISDCIGGQWINGDASQTQRGGPFQLQLPNIGSVAYTGAGASTAKATNTMYCTEIDMPYSRYTTGLGMLNGAATGTDKWVLALYDNTGNLIANSATAGVVASGSSTFQKQAFTTPYYIVGPAQYFACAQGDSGTTATINLIATGTQDTYLTKKFASQTFGTLAAIAVPTTFTTASGGFWILY